MKTTVEIPDELFRKAKTLAASRGLSFKEVLIHSLASELENIVDIGLENTKKTQPKRREKKPLQVVFAKSEKLVLPKPDFLVNWEFDPAQVLLEDRKLRNDFLLS
jgi:hypothetical protein